jgi:ribosomal-protein-alanine N-acetyltransferase
MILTCRRASRADLPFIHAADRRHSPVFRNIESYERLLGPGGLLLVAEAESEVIGFAAFRLCVDEAELLNIAVLPPLRRRGCADALLRAGLEGLAESGIHRLFLEVRPSNQAARAFYEQRGFAADGHRRGYYAATPGRAAEDALLMSLAIDTAVQEAET